MRKPLVLLVTLALALSGPIPAQGAAGEARPPGARPVAGQQPHRVTLITGDVVTFFADNQFTVEPAPRPDGRRVTFTGRTGDTVATARDFYVFPSDVIGDPRLDPELFNVKGLVREGLDRAESLPVLVKDPKARSAKPYSNRKIDHRQNGRFWRDLGKDTKVWLDHRRKVVLDVSVPQIGAPDAWRAGHDGTGVTVAVIDTGIDANHPDLSGRVVAAQNFTTDPDAGDYHGHGTHVASTIAGSGAASGGRYKGVAPGAKLINAKGCDGGGYCYDSWIMAAMDYAAHSGARVINMSIGGGISDGTDPLSLEVNRLTEQTGALFVVAAGNYGEYGAVTVGSPGAAAAALTVGAVDRDDKLASFSSRGPRYRDAAIKPDLTAPGVGIVAARASGTVAGTPVDENYTAMSGTSMATPHVAGAAAILAGQHTDWKAGRLKDTLVSTVKPTAGKVIDEGAGRVDVSRAFQATVTGSAAVDFGRMERRSIKHRKITYRNDGDRGVLLRLRLAGSGWNGDPLPRGAIAMSPIVWVPAHGTAHAHVIVNTYVGGYGSFSGIVTATGAGISLRTPISYYSVTPTHELTVRVIDHNGQQVWTRVNILRDDFDPVRNNDPFAQVFFDGVYDADGTVRARVPVGSYSTVATLYADGLTARPRWTGLSKVDVPVRRATAVTMDARESVPVTLGTGDTQERVRNVSFSRTVNGGGGVIMGCSCLGAEVRATPTPEPRFGVLSLQNTWTLGDRVSWVSAGGRQLDPKHDPYKLSVTFAGESTQPVVWAGDGTDFTGIDVDGKVALVGLVVSPDAEDPTWDAFQAGYNASRKAKAAGAAAIAAYVDVAGAIGLGNTFSDIPYLGLSREEGLAVRAAGSLHIKTKPAPDFLYNLHYSVPNGISADMAYTLDPAKLTRVESEYHADKPGFDMMRSWVAFRKDAAGMMVSPRVFLPARSYVAEHAGGSPDAIENVNWSRIGVISDGNGNGITMYNRTPLAAKDVWFAGPSSPGGFDSSGGAFFRASLPGGPQVLFPSSYMGDGAVGHLVSVDYFGYCATRYRLYRDGTEIPGEYSPFSCFPIFPVPDEAATYRLDAVTVLPASGLGGPTLATRTLSPRVDTSWTFGSDRGTPKPCYVGSPWECKVESLLQPFYDLRLDLSNSAPASRPHTIGVAVQRTDTGAAATLAGLTVSYSTDEGATWQPTTVENGQVTIQNPASGYVWLRIEAWTPEGDRVTQTTQRIYRVR